jgi:DNA uptake protein ComE-like DNA-binding protein
MIQKVSLGFLLSVGLVAGGVLPSVHAQSQPSAAAQEAKVNINTASKSELMIAYREKNGPFKTPEGIRKVSGIGKGLWEVNREAITVK